MIMSMIMKRHQHIEILYVLCICESHK